MLFASQPARAIEFLGARGPRTAEVSFVQLGTNLVVTLSNISHADARQPADVLTSIFFSLAGSPTVTPVSASLGPNSTVLFAPAGGAGPNVSDEWAYQGNLKGIPGGSLDGISSVALGKFKLPNFNGPELHPPPAFGSLDYGITSAGDKTNTGNIYVTGKYPLIQDSVVFTLALPSTYIFTNVTKVEFQYGTSFGNPRFSGVLQSNAAVVIPEPSSLGLAACGIGLLLIVFTLGILTRPASFSGRH